MSPANKICDFPIATEDWTGLPRDTDNNYTVFWDDLDVAVRGLPIARQAGGMQSGMGTRLRWKPNGGTASRPC